MKKIDVKGIIPDYLPWLILGVVILVMLMIATLVQQGVLDSFIDKIKNPIR
jgi:hypothetical protein